MIILILKKMIIIIINLKKAIYIHKLMVTQQAMKVNQMSIQVKINLKLLLMELITVMQELNTILLMIVENMDLIDMVGTIINRNFKEKLSSK